jgi:Citrate lyase beta subunit
MSQKLRRSMLFVPGNNPGMVRDAGIYGADSVIFDLEDAIPVAEKDAARFLVQEALLSLTFGSAELLVRINGLDTPFAVPDMKAIVSTGRAAIRLPKAECAQDILHCAAVIEDIEQENQMEVGSTKIVAAIESAKGVLNAKEIAHSSKRLVALALAAEDYSADLKTARSKEGTELLFGRNMILHAARSAGIDAIDSVFSDANDEEGLRTETAFVKQLGFDGKSVINPRQIRPIHEVFTPTAAEIEKAIHIVDAFERAQECGSGIVSMNGKMVDRPVVLRAMRVLDLIGPVAVLKARESQ